MKSFIRELYYGNINPTAKTYDKKSDFGKSMDKVAMNEEKLMNMLTGKEKELFEEFCKAYSDVDYTTGCESFVDGFRMGAEFMLNTFIIKDKVFQDIE